jgi:hypothetical protein
MANTQINVTANGTKTLATAGKYCDRNIDVNVTVPIPDGYIKPTGSKSITSNGTHDVTSVASAVVNVPVPSGYIKPSGSKSITENGTHDVTQYASAVVNVPQKATKFTNYYQPEYVTVKTRADVSSSAVTLSTDNQCNCIKIPYHHVAGEAVVMRIRGIGTVRDRYNAGTLAADGTTVVKNYSLASSSTSYFTMGFDEHGDATITFKSNLVTLAWEYFIFNFQYVGTNTNATVQTGPIITINEPIGNGGYAG